MERLNNRLNYSGQTYETSKDLRISNRPSTHNLNAFGYNPSTLGSSKKKGESGVRNGSQSSQTRQKFKPAYTEPRSSNKPSTTTRRDGVKPMPQSSEESSEDEMDFLSEASHIPDDPSCSQKPVSSPKKSQSQLEKFTNATTSRPSTQRDNPKPEDLYIDSKGKSHQYHSDYKPINKLAGMSFKSNKSKTKGSDATTLTENRVDSSSSSRRQEPVPNENTILSINGPSSWSPIRQAPSSNLEKGKDDIVDLSSSPSKSCDDNDVVHASPLSGKSAKSNRAHTPPPSLPHRSNGAGASGAGESRGRITKERPKPVPIHRGAPKAAHLGDSRDVADNLGLRSRQRPKSPSPEPSSSRNGAMSSSKYASKKSNDGLKPAPFPLESLDFLTQPEVTNTKTKSSIGSSLRAKPFPMLEKSGNTRVASQAITPVRPAKEKAQPKGKGRSRKIIASSDDSDGGEDKAASPLRPKAFPMAGTNLSPSLSPRPAKRNSDHGSEDERTVKKSRKGKDHLLDSANAAPFFEEGDSMSLAPHADPKTLCPFCDTSLPRYPSPLLLKLLEETKRKAGKDPRPSNPLGLRAPLTTYIAVCRRHLFESKILPEAERKGWPKTIKWKKVSGRVLKMKDFLQALIEDTGDVGEETTKWEIIYGGSTNGKGKGKAKGPKANSIFWMETMAEIEKKGLRAIHGVRGQFANFEKAQPGYYGEMGSVLIYQTLYNMFPPTEIDPNHVSPLTPTEFLQRILVPEVALHLIMEDQDLDGEDGMKEALEILRDSSSYGVAMFPEDGGEWGENKRRDKEKMGEADLIVMERARKRRKELEEEEREEERRLQDEENRKAKEEHERVEAEKAKKTQRGRTERKASVSQEPPAERPRPRPIPIKKSKSTMSSSTPASEDERNPSNERWARSRSRSNNITSDESDLEKDMGNSRRPSSEERRRSPSASESWAQGNTRRNIPSRAPSHDMARLSIGRDDVASDSSTRALVNGEGRTSSQDMKIDNTDSEVEIVDDIKTPIPKRQRRRIVDVDDDDDDTPKLDRSRKPDRPEETLAPLERARLRKGASKPGPSKNSLGSLHSTKSQDFGWLINDSSPRH